MLSNHTNQVSWLLDQQEPQPANTANLPAAVNTLAFETTDTATITPVVNTPASDVTRGFAKFKAAVFQSDKNTDSAVLGRPVALNDQGMAVPLHNATLAALARTSPGMHSLFQPVLRKRSVIQLVQDVAYGNEEAALKIAERNPSLLTIKVTANQREHAGTVKTYSGKMITEMTAFQAALCEGDEVMAVKLKEIYLKANPTNGQAILDAQFNEIFPNGYATHLEKQKQDAEKFEREVLNPLVDAFTAASPADLQAALDKHDNGSELCQTLKGFKEAFNALSHGEKVYNPQHLLKVLEKYNAKFDAWHINDNNPDRWLRLDLFWRQVIGWEQRYMTANYAQSFCTGWSCMVEDKKLLQRTLKLYNYHINREIDFFPLVVDPVSSLGSDFGISGLVVLGRPGGTAYRVVAGGADWLLQNLRRANTANLGTLCSANRIIAQRPVA